MLFKTRHKFLMAAILTTTAYIKYISHYHSFPCKSLWFEWQNVENHAIMMKISFRFICHKNITFETFHSIRNYVFHPHILFACKQIIHNTWHNRKKKFFSFSFFSQFFLSCCWLLFKYIVFLSIMKKYDFPKLQEL